MRKLSKGRTKVAVLVTKPQDPAAPTRAELEAGIDAAPHIPASMWTWRAGTPNTVDDPPLSAAQTVQVPNESTYDLSAGVYREFAAAGGFDADEEALFEATREIGTTLWVYARKTDKMSIVPWADDDEIYLGGEVQTGDLIESDEGNIKYSLPLFAQNMHKFIKVGPSGA